MTSKGLDIHKNIKKLLTDYKDARKSSIVQVEQIANTRNKFTYVTNEKLQSSLGSTVNSSKLNLLLSDELYDQANKLSSFQQQMKLSIESLTQLMTADEKVLESLPVDVSMVRQVIGEMQQQLLLETMIADKLSSYDEGTISPDMLVTFLACFSYPPHLVMGNIELILSC